MVFNYMSFKKPIAESNLAKDADWLLNWRETLIFFKSVLVHFKLLFNLQLTISGLAMLKQD